MKCYNCDGLGWLYLEDFRELIGGEVYGDSPGIIFANAAFGVCICPDCDGKGREPFLSMIIDAMVALAS